MKNYGNGPSTGLDQTAAGRITTGFTPKDLEISEHDVGVSRRLAEEVAAIAASERMAGVRELWTRHNMLEPVRPVIFCDPENGWKEIITEELPQPDYNGTVREAHTCGHRRTRSGLGIDPSGPAHQARDNQGLQGRDHHEGQPHHRGTSRERGSVEQPCT